MKKIFVLFFIGTFLLSCEEDRSDNYLKETVAYFSTDSGKLPAKETDGASGTNYMLSVISTFPNSSDRVVTIEIDTEKSTAIEGEHFTIDTSSLTIPANEYSTDIIINSVYENLPQEPVTLVLNLVSVTGTDLMVSKSTFNLEIYKSCEIVDFPLSYTAFVSAFNDSAPTHQQNFTAIPNSENYYYVVSSWGPNFVAWATNDSSYNGQYPYSGNLQINCDNTVVFEGLDTWATGGTGTYDPASGIITITVGQTLFTTDFTATIMFVPNP